MMQNRGLAVGLVLATLCMKLIVPAGFMPMSGANGVVTVSICTGSGPQTVAMLDVGERGDGGMSDHAKAQPPCAFSGLGLAAVAAIDPIVLAIGLAFILTIGFGALLCSPSAMPARLRPPLRGPPISG